MHLPNVNAMHSYNIAFLSRFMSKCQSFPRGFNRAFRQSTLLNEDKPKHLAECQSQALLPPSINQVL